MNPPKPLPPVVVLAAGKSSRMGTTKALLSFPCTGGKSFIATILDTCNTCRLPTVVVIRPDQKTLAQELDTLAQELTALAQIPASSTPASTPQLEFSIAENPNPDSEMVDSFYLGLAQTPWAKDTGAFIWPVDAPGVRHETLQTLTKLATSAPEKMVVPTYEGKRGHPTFLPNSVVSELINTPRVNGFVPLEAAIHTLLDRLHPQIVEIPVDDPMVRANLNRPEDLQEHALSPPSRL